MEPKLAGFAGERYPVILPEGCVVAMVTPFEIPPAGAVAGSSAAHTATQVDLVAVAGLIRRLCMQDVAGVVVCGSTGESVSLSKEERTSILRASLVARDDAQTSQGKMQVIMGVGGGATHQALEIALMAKEESADALLVAPPYYCLPTQEGLCEYFTTIAKAVADLPVILYDIPKRVGVSLEASVVGELIQENSNILGIKEAESRAGELMAVIRAQTSEEFVLYCGQDDLTWDFMEAGARGLISVSGNLIAPAWVRFFSNYGQPQGRESALKIWKDEIEPAVHALGRHPNPSGIKALMARAGLLGEVLRSPLLPLDDKDGDHLWQTDFGKLATQERQEQQEQIH